MHEHFQDVYDSVENPLKDCKWWQTARNLWQCFAECNTVKYLAYAVTHQSTCVLTSKTCWVLAGVTSLLDCYLANFLSRHG